jgi:hypothetical protein
MPGGSQPCRGPIGPGGSSLNGAFGLGFPVFASNRNCVMKFGPGVEIDWD